MAAAPKTGGETVKAVSLRPQSDRFARSPQLAPLAILEAALGPCEAALLAAHDELVHGALSICERGSGARRAHSVLVAGRRLAVALAAYQEALGRAERRKARDRYRDIPF